MHKKQHGMICYPSLNLYFSKFVNSSYSPTAAAAPLTPPFLFLAVLTHMVRLWNHCPGLHVHVSLCRGSFRASGTTTVRISSSTAKKMATDTDPSATPTVNLSVVMTPSSVSQQNLVEA